MFMVYFINHFYYADQSFGTAAEAVDFGKSKGFEFRVDTPTQIVCSWDPFNGRRHHLSAVREGK